MIERVKKTLDNRSLISVLLLISLTIFVFVLPALEIQTAAFPVLLISLIIFLASYSISRRLVLLGFLVVVIEVGMRTTDYIYLNYLAMITTNLFFIYIVGNVILDVMKQKTVTLFTLIEAINGYLLLGIMFISLVASVELSYPGSYPLKDDEGIELVYYTMVTLTTVGYGDITPQLPIAKSLSMIIAVCGQFYIAMVVAIIVGKYASGTNKSDK